jgi:hypothetical protein
VGSSFQSGIVLAKNQYSKRSVVGNLAGGNSHYSSNHHQNSGNPSTMPRVSQKKRLMQHH